MAKKINEKSYKEILRHEDVKNNESNQINDKPEETYLKEDLARIGKFIVIATVLLIIATVLFSDFTFAINIRESLGFDKI
jgi:hypothetical protein